MVIKVFFKMKRLIILNIFLSLFILSSCSNSIVSSFKKELKDSDKIKIYFYKNDTSKSGKFESIVNIDDKSEIQNFINCISEKDEPFYKCGFTGSIEFFKNNLSIINMEFNVQPGCRHIIFKFRDTMFSKDITDDGIKLINQYYEKTKTY